ncbi:Uncharacterised protein [Mycobacteroides abscessus subsp. abscessus]|nr:Uncharacterised protein [Mycobacteroides abscessus subsp. abscessus]
MAKGKEPQGDYDYYDLLKECERRLTRQKPKPPPIDEWREIPGFPGYLMHGGTREVWSQRRQVTRSDGKLKTFDAKLITPSRGRLSLSVDGKRTTRSVAQLLALTFPETQGTYWKYGRDENRRCKKGHPLTRVAYWGSWNRVCLLCFPAFGEPGERLCKEGGAKIDYDAAVLDDGVAEWLGGDGAHTVTRQGGMRGLTAAEEEKYRKAGELERQQRGKP